MILYRWQGSSPNFGDELNTILWPNLLPGFFDEDPAVRFLGIGSVLDRRHSPEATKLVAGSGYGGYERKPRLAENWIIHWVRGPGTAAALGISPALALGDPAALIPAILGPPATGANDIGFMPHFESMEQGAWRLATRIAGISLIDPRDPPLTILAAIGRCKLLLSEALHGVIVADAMRVPWVAIRPLAGIHRAKWRDWADSLGVRPRFRKLPASSLSEWAATHLSWTRQPVRHSLGRRENRLAAMMAEQFSARAGEALRLAARGAPQLSADAALARCQSRMLDAVHVIRAQPFGGVAYSTTSAVRRCRLQASGDSAYQLRPIS